MQGNKKWFTKQMMIVILLFILAACTPATTLESTPLTALPTSTSQAPALEPVTATPERLFTPDPRATKTLLSNDQLENDEFLNDADTQNGGAILVYERAGGLKGIGPSVITWSMYADGRVVSSDGRSWQVPPEDITTLVDSIMTLGFADFEASYIPQDTCCDRATHTITLYRNGEVYQVSVLDSADAPAELYQTIDLIGKFLVTLPTT